MLTFTEISQLSDRDLADEAKRTRDSLFRQKMGVRTRHLKDSHLVEILKKYLAQLLTEKTRRAKLGEKVEKTADEVSKKTKEFSAEIAKMQVAKKETTDSKKVAEAAEEKIETKSSDGVKVKKVEKKGLFKKTEK